MRRTQLYLDDQLWGALHAQARKEKTTVSELVRRAARQRYVGSGEERRSAMEQFVGVRKSAGSRRSATDEVRTLRRGTRVDRLGSR